MTTWPALHTFRARLTLRWTLAVGLLLGAANLVVYLGVQAYVHDWFDHNLRTVAATEAASSTDGTTDVHLHEGAFSQLDSGVFTEKLVQIFDRQGRLILQSTARAGRPPIVTPSVLQEAFDGLAPLQSTILDGRPLRLAVLTAEREGHTYAVAVGLFADDVEAGLASLAWLLASVWLVCLGATAAIGYLLASRALAPVARITERADWIAQGHFEGRLDSPQVEDEVGRMTVLLNSMLDRLRTAMEANRRFASDASHEMRGPLTAMAGEIDVTLRHPRSAEHYEETLQHVRGRVSALIALAEDLILLVRVQEGAREIIRREVPVAPLVEDAFTRLRDPARARGVTLRHTSLEGICLYADPALIAHVIDNVMTNAVHYNRDNGWVDVTAEVDEPADADEWATAMVRLQIHDTGPGIPADQQARVFERFYRLDQSRARHTGGSGLGLAICREVLALHDGTIGVAASSQAGTTMEIRLPGCRTDVAARMRAPANPMAAGSAQSTFTHTV